jgi:SAM-dependent methyltransferase
MPERTELPDISPAAARDWIARWDRQQEAYLPDREDRFTALIDAVEAGTGRPDPLVLDLGCGPGSLSVRLLRRLPSATVIAVDADPVTLSLGRAAYAGIPGLAFRDIDLRARDWPSRAGIGPGRPVDAAVSTTALHWLSAGELRDLYAALAGLLRPGGLFLDGDHLRLPAAQSPVLAALEQALEDRARLRHSGAGQGGQRGQQGPGSPEGRGQQGQGGQPGNWHEWWQAAAADPALAAAAAERERRGMHHHGPEGDQLAVHVSALRAAGFTEVGTIWQHGPDKILAAVR